MVDLKNILHNRKWVSRQFPFPHIVARDIFVPKFYRELSEHFSLMVDQPRESKAAKQLRRIPGYDAFGRGFDEHIAGPLSVFVSEAWHDLLAGLYHVPATGHINVGLHHHAVGSANGSIHSDFNSVWYPTDLPGRIKFPRHLICSYKKGEGSLPAENKVQVVRAVAMLFYIANDHWVPGAGGETGLFDSRGASHTNPVAKVRPINNSILIFECIPNSFHAFLHNATQPRNSVIMWIHRSLDEVRQRWGESEIEQWAA
jgi:2-oxoglutarate-Fe(II)-dependent oxygenase superfamily protein